MTPSAQIRLSVVTVAYNSTEALRRTLPAVESELTEHDELIVVDNASGDSTPETVRTMAPRARLVEAGSNTGFARGCNLGAEAAGGDLLVFINPDAAPAPGFRAAIAAPMHRQTPWGAWMGLVTCEAGHAINTSGGILHFTGIAWAGESGRPVPAGPMGPREVPFLSGACLAITRSEWLRVGGFGERFFMYHEDVDLSLRLRLAGTRIGIEPDARVDHDYEFDKGTEKWRLLERNRWATILRCYPAALLALIAPALVATELALLVVAAAGGWLTPKLKAYGELVRMLPDLLEQRGAIQATRSISTAEFASCLTAELSSPYLGRPEKLRLVNHALRVYWAVVRLALRHLR